MVFLREFFGALARVCVYALLLFAPAGTLRWPRAWILLALTLVALLLTRFWGLIGRADLREARRRSPFQPGQPLADKIVVAGFVVAFPAYLIFIPLDVFRFHLLAPPAAFGSDLGLLLAATGWLLIALSFRANAFAVPIVVDQVGRGQTVVETGAYRLIRHPLYAGVVLVLIGVALWLGSLAAAVGSILPVAVVIARIVVEERFLNHRLDGYRAYAARVRYRLIPGIW